MWKCMGSFQKFGQSALNWFVAFAGFSGANILIIVDFRLPT